MNACTLTLIDRNQATLVGDLNFDTVVDLLRQGKHLLENQDNLAIDLKGITRCNSAGLALLTAWMRHAKKLRKEIKFVHVPVQLLAMAKVSSLEKILPMK